MSGVVQRQLASESLAAAAASGAQLPEGNPICELGLAATEAAVDVWVTHVSRSLAACKFGLQSRGILRHFSPVPRIENKTISSTRNEKRRFGSLSPWSQAFNLMKLG